MPDRSNRAGVTAAMIITLAVLAGCQSSAGLPQASAGFAGTSEAVSTHQGSIAAFSLGRDSREGSGVIRNSLRLPSREGVPSRSAKIAVPERRPALAERMRLRLEKAREARQERREKLKAARKARKPGEKETATAAQKPRKPKSAGRGKNRYDDLIVKYARKEGVPVALARAVVQIESSFRPNVRGAAGEIGLMQIKPSTARGMGYKGPAKALYDPEVNIRWGMKYLGKAHRLGGGKTCGTILKYNAGHGAKRMNKISAGYCAKVKRVLTG